MVYEIVLPTLGISRWTAAVLPLHFVNLFSSNDHCSGSSSLGPWLRWLTISVQLETFHICICILRIYFCRCTHTHRCECILKVKWSVYAGNHATSRAVSVLSKVKYTKVTLQIQTCHGLKRFHEAIFHVAQCSRIRHKKGIQICWRKVRIAQSPPICRGNQHPFAILI